MNESLPSPAAIDLEAEIQPVCDAIQFISDASMVFGSFSRESNEITGETTLNISTDAKGFVNPENRRQFAVRVHLTLNLANSKKETMALIEASYVIRYETKDFQVSDTQADQYAQYNGVFNAWPYWREYVQTCSTRMGMPTLPVPVYRQGMTAVTSLLLAEGRQQSREASGLPAFSDQRNP